jgi:hypothetical protein
MVGVVGNQIFKRGYQNVSIGIEDFRQLDHVMQTYERGFRRGLLIQADLLLRAKNSDFVTAIFALLACINAN